MFVFAKWRGRFEHTCLATLEISLSFEALWRIFHASKENGIQFI